MKNLFEKGEKKSYALSTQMLTVIVVLLISTNTAAQHPAISAVSQQNSTCPTNGSITATVSNPASQTGWNLILSNQGSNIPVQTISVPSNGGNLTFTNLAAGIYILKLFDGINTIPHNSTIILTSSYVNMSGSAATTSPNCSGGTDGTITIDLSTGGTPPFTYTIEAPQGNQSATTLSRKQSFSGITSSTNIPYSVQDACSIIWKSSIVSTSFSKPNLAFTIRGVSFFRDSNQCGTPKVYINLNGGTINGVANRLNTLKTPGNATIKINNSTTSYNLTYVGMVGSDHRFTYDAVASGGPVLIPQQQIEIIFKDECGNELTNKATIRLSDDYLNVGWARIVDPNTCKINYKFTIIGDEDNQGSNPNTLSRNVFFLPENTVIIEKRDPVNTLVFTEIFRGSMNVVNINTTTLPSAVATHLVSEPGYYRIKASDACHSVINTKIITESDLSSVGITVSGSTLQGTVGINLNNTGGVAFPLTVKVERNDGQTNMTINPNAPFNLAGTYNITFPITYTFTNGQATSIVDLPKGDYKISLTDNCSSVSGITKTFNTTDQLVFVPADYQFTSNGTSYKTFISKNENCETNSSIFYTHSRNNSTWRPTTVELRTRTANGSEGSLISSKITGTNNTLDGTFTNLKAGNYVVKFITSNSGFSAALNSYINGFNYFANADISPYQNPNVSLTSINCDPVNNTSFITSKITSGRIVYPLTMTLFRRSDSLETNPIQTISLNKPSTETTFKAVANGQYKVKTTSLCYTSNDNITVSNSTSAPTAVALTPLCSSNKNTTLGLNIAADLFDVTWVIVNPNNTETIVGTGSPLNITTNNTTNYKARFSLKQDLICNNKNIYEAPVTVDITDDPNLRLSVNDIDLCQNNSPQVTIDNTQNKFVYEIVDALGESFNPKVIGIGNNGILSIPIPTHVQLLTRSTLKVTSTNGNPGCKGTLNNVIKINQRTPNTSLMVSGSSICSGDGSITVFNSEIGVVYTVLKNSCPLSPSLTTVGNGNNLMFLVPSVNLTDGNNEYIIQASGLGCTTGQLANKAIIAVNKPPITSLLVNPVCGTPGRLGRLGSFSVLTPGGSNNILYSIDSINFSSKNSFTNLNPGIYTIYSKDVNKGCLTQSTIELKENCLQIEKTANKTFYSEAGNIITYTFKVKNIGPDRAFNIQISDTLPGISAIYPSSVSSLLPDATVEFTATYTITQEDINNGTLTNTAMANAKTSDNFRYSSNTSGVTISATTPISATGFILKGQWINGNNAELIWNTLTEQNSSYFLIEKSFDGINFSSIGSKINAAGFSSVSKTYIGYDYKVIDTQIVYYRIRLVDLGSNSRFSNTVILKLNANGDIKIYPNPVRRVINLLFSKAGWYDIQLFGYNGQLIKKIENINIVNVNQPFSIERNNILEGSYILRIFNKNSGDINNYKLILVRE